MEIRPENGLPPLPEDLKANRVVARELDSLSGARNLSRQQFSRCGPIFSVENHPQRKYLKLKEQVMNSLFE